MHLSIYLQDPAKPQGPLRVWNGPAGRFELENATEDQVLEAIATAAAERAKSAARKAISAERAWPRTPPAARSV